MWNDFRFTGKAIAALAEIMDWTETTFGPEQAARYRDALIGRLEGACSGAAQLRPLERLTRANRHHGLFTVRSGRHIVVVKPERTSLVVIDILHEVQDLASHEFLEKDD